MIGITATYQPLSLAAIIDDRRYTEQVLQLHNDQTEQNLDNRVLEAAKAAGVEQDLWSPLLPSPDTYTLSLPMLSSPSTASPSPPSRRSTSMDSHKTWSTGLTSAHSRPSVDHSANKPSPSSPTKRFLNFSRLTSSTTVGSSTVNSSRNHSTTTLDTASNRSSFSVADPDHSPRKRSSTLKRGLSRLKLRRSHIEDGVTHSAPRTCLRCTQSHEPVQRTATISLPCNHDICRAHLRKLVVNALISRRNSALSCCSRPFPRETLLEVAKPDEIAIVLKEVLTPTSDHYDPFQELAHRAVSPASTEHEGIWTLRNDSGWTVPDNTILSLPQHDGVAENEETAQRNAYYALIDPDFRELRNAQLDERDRFLAYAREQKRNFARYREQSRVDFTTTCEQQQNDLAQAHALALTKLEEKHLTVELDLATAQEQEKRNCLLALRHMSAYCQNLTNPLNPHTVTDQDRHELERQCWLRDNMDQRHHSAINVLREQQARQLRQRALKQEGEMVALMCRQEVQREELEKVFEREEAEIERVAEERKERMSERWRLATEVWKKGRSDVGAIRLAHPIAGVEWPEEDTRDAIGEEEEDELDTIMTEAPRSVGSVGVEMVADL